METHHQRPQPLLEVSREEQKGFTLIELIMVIVLLGILAVVAIPRFTSFAEDARRASFQAIASAFRSGVDQVHIAWLVRGNGEAVQNFIEIDDSSVLGSLSVNSFGFPADTRGISLTLNSSNDCEDVFRAVLLSQDVRVETDDSEMFQAQYLGNGSCRYTFLEQPELTIDYNSETGDVAVDLV